MLGPFIPGSRGTFMLDGVSIALAVVLPVLAFSIFQIKVRRNVAVHGWIQKLLGVLLLVTVILFEIDIRINGWVTQASASPYFATLVFPVLYVHLFFAVSTALLWTYTLTLALRRPPRLDGGDDLTKRHRLFGRLTALFTFTTAITGWTFYWLAFIA